MARLILPRSFNSQPPFPAPIDSHHPLGSLVTAAIAAHYDGCRREMVTGRHATTAGTAPDIVMKQRGVASSITGNQGLYYPAAPIWADGSTSFSVDLLYEGNGGSSNQFDRVFDFGGNAASGGWNIEVQSTTTQLNFTTWNGASPTNSSFGSVNIFGAGVVTHLAAVYDKTASTLKLYVNGVQVGAFTGLTVTTTTKTNAFYACSATNGANAGKLGLHFLRVYQGTILTPGQIAELYANPWQLYKYPNRVIAPVVIPPVIGTMAVTEQDDLFAANGIAFTGAAGSFHEANDTLAASGSLQHNAQGAVTETADSFVGNGSVPRTGHITVTAAADTFSAHGGASFATSFDNLTLTPAPAHSFISAIIPLPFGGEDTQNGQTIVGEDGKHYSVSWVFNQATLIRAEDGTQHNISSATFVADQLAHGLPGIGTFVPGYGAVGIPNTPYFYLWAMGGEFLFGQPCHFVFLRYRVNNVGAFVPDGGSVFVYDSTGGNVKFTMTTSGGNGVIYGANAVSDQVYIAYEAAGHPGNNHPVIAAIPFNSTFDATERDWLAHNHELTSEFGLYYWQLHYRVGISIYNNCVCLADNGDGTGSAIAYRGTSEIATSSNTNINTLGTPQFQTFDFKFTPSGTGGTWTIGSLYNQIVSGITFPFADTNKNRFDLTGGSSSGDDYYSPNILKINGKIYMVVLRAYPVATDWAPTYVGLKALICAYTKGHMAFSDVLYKNSPYDPANDFGFAGDRTTSALSSMQAFVAGNEIWSKTTYSGDGQFVYSRLFFVHLPTQGLRFSLLRDPDYVDWASTGDPGDFTSFLETWWMMPPGSAVFAQAPWVIAYVSQEDIDPSLFFTPKWEWTESLAIHKSGPKTQAYKSRPHSTVGDFRIRVRGKGRALQMRWESESGKPFNLLGWSVDAQNNAEP